MAADGRLCHGEREAAGRTALADALRREGVTLLRARPLAGGGRLRLAPRERLELWFVVGQLLEAGLPLDETLRELEAPHHAAPLRRLAGALRVRVEGGAALSAALADHPAAVDPLAVALVAVGERSGELAEVAARLHRELAWRAELAGRLQRLLLYPAVTLAVVGGVTLFLLLEVVPGLAALGSALGRPPSAETRWLLAAGRWAGILLPLLAVAAPPLLLAGTLILRRSERLLTIRDRWLLGVWWIGPQLRRAALARLARALALMYRAGLPLLEALAVAARVAGNRAVAAATARVLGAVERGTPLSEAFAGAELFPPLLVRMVALGERSGGLDRALGRVAELEEQALREALERAAALLEPLLTLLLGGLLGGVVLAVMGPLFDLIGSLGR
ncbi:type II secretion system inner membrane protein GspF [Endothiovibrio diazotrophicus]